MGEPDSMAGGLLDKAGAARYLATTERHIEKLWSTRRISGIHVGRKVRFSRADLDDFVERSRSEAVR
jgi:excisionase family DNA binding protein